MLHEEAPSALTELTARVAMVWTSRANATARPVLSGASQRQRWTTDRPTLGQERALGCLSRRRRGKQELWSRTNESAATAPLRFGAGLDVRTDLIEAPAMYTRLGYHEVPRFNNHCYVEHWFEKSL